VRITAEKEGEKHCIYLIA